MKKALRKNDIIARTGGDEFAAIIINEHSINTDNLTARIKREFAIYNEETNRPYDLEISIGFNSIVWSKDINFAKELKIADDNMYLDKQKKKAFKKKL